MDESMTPHPTVIEPGYSVGRGGGGRVISFKDMFDRIPKIVSVM